MKCRVRESRLISINEDEGKSTGAGVSAVYQSIAVNRAQTNSHAGRGTRLPPTWKLARPINTKAFVETKQVSARQKCSCGNPTEVMGHCVVSPQERQMGQSKLDLLQGTLDVMVLQTLEAMGPQHGYGVARRIEQASGNEVLLNQGTIYASLVRLQQRGWIAAKWGTSDNNRKAKVYSITKSGQKQLVQATAYWQRLAGVMGRVLAMQGGGDEQLGIPFQK